MTNQISIAPYNSKVEAQKEPMIATQIQNWLVKYLAKELEITPDEVHVTIPFDDYGLDSYTAVGMSGDLEDWLGCELDPTLLYDYPTIDTRARYLALRNK